MNQTETLRRRKWHLEWQLLVYYGTINQLETMLNEVPLPPTTRLDKRTRLKLMALIYSQRSAQQAYLAQYTEVRRSIKMQ